VAFGNRNLATFLSAVLFLGFFGTSGDVTAAEPPAVGSSSAPMATATYTLMSSTNSGSDSPQRANSSYSGTIGLGLIGAELGFVIPAAAGLREPWSLTAFPIAGAAGGAVGGYFLLDKGARHPTAAFNVLVVAAMALIIPGLMLTNWTSPNRPIEEPINYSWALSPKVKASQSSPPSALQLASTAGPVPPAIGTDDLKKKDTPPPDPDRDQDGVSDEIDACLELAGSINVDPKKNGCPIETGRNETVTDSGTALSQQIKFAHLRAKLNSKSIPTLVAVLEMLNHNGEIKRLKLEGHADSTGSTDVNIALSERRAYKVLKWLTDHGIKRSRLTIQGFGSEKPIAPNDTAEGRRDNRRVEFHIELAD
jgi:outer membrane protein OmpA-like peptidoglycan-associated protein